MVAPAGPEVRAKALKIYATKGPTAAALACGVAKSTVCKWAKQEGVETQVPALIEATAHSTARRRLSAAEWREEMTELLRDITTSAASLELALLAQRGTSTPRLNETSATRTKAVSDLLLITGEATQRIGLQGDQEEHAASIAKLRDELAERRKAAG